MFTTLHGAEIESEYSETKLRVGLRSRERHNRNVCYPIQSLAQGILLVGVRVHPAARSQFRLIPDKTIRGCLNREGSRMHLFPAVAENRSRKYTTRSYSWPESQGED